MANGYTGKILRVNLTTQKISTINTSQYEQWGGGHGICSAIFWDLCKDKTVSGRDPGNVVTIMTSPLTGTQAPCAGRTELTGIGLESYPIEWYNRGNFGGRFGVNLKMAGWDGIVIEGRANALCWIKIVDDKVSIEDAKPIKGMDAWDTQTYLWALQSEDVRGGHWKANNTQRPAILCTAAAGEAGSRMACLIHDAGNAVGEGGFGGVFGSKNLKAVSVIGTGSIEVADPRGLFDARRWLMGQVIPVPAGPASTPTFRASGCAGCAIPCRRRDTKSSNNDSQCTDTKWYAGENLENTNPQMPLPEQQVATEFVQRYAINATHARELHIYLGELYRAGILGKGKAVDPYPLIMESYGTLGFSEEYLKAISSRQGIGADLSEGAARAALKWGRLEQDLDSGLMQFPQWGYPYHSSGEPQWAYGSLLGERDVNEHTMRSMYPSKALAKTLPAGQLAEMMAKKLIPYDGDPFMVDYSDGPPYGIYSLHFAKLIAWNRHYGRFWKQSVQYCDQSDFIPSFMPSRRAKIGLTPDAEPRFFNAVTGQNLSFADGVELGRKIWNLDRAIWVLQGRSRDLEKFAGFMHKPGMGYGGAAAKTNKTYCSGKLGDINFPVYKDGKWGYDNLKERVYSREGVEAFKTAFYELEGWDTRTGSPTRKTLESLGLKNVADELAAKGKLPG